MVFNRKEKEFLFIYLFILNFYLTGTGAALPMSNVVGEKADHSPYLVLRWEWVKLYLQSPHAFMDSKVTFHAHELGEISKNVKISFETQYVPILNMITVFLASDTGSFSLKSKSPLLPTPTPSNVRNKVQFMYELHEDT